MKLNTQPPEQKVPSERGDLSVHSIFPTIQGEGPFAGETCLFVRLAGCNLQCPMCDTEYTLGRTQWGAGELAFNIGSQWPNKPRHGKRPLIVITGGEPFRQNIGPLCELLVSAGYRVQIETNGTLFCATLPYIGVTIVCSPKTGAINPDLAPHIAAFKYVVQAGFIDPDGLPKSTLGKVGQILVAKPPHIARHNGAEIYVQPLDEQDEAKNAANMAAAVQSCMAHGYRLCIQTHKISGVP